MFRLAAVSVIFVLACGGSRRDERTPVTHPTQVPAEPTLAEPRVSDAGIVSPPPEVEAPHDVPHGAVRSDRTLFAQTFPDAGTRGDAAPGDAGLPDAGRDAGSRDAPGPGDAGRDAR